MKLGIVVVYLVTERNEKLLDLHLSQIENNTEVPYKIYGSAARLYPKFRQKLQQNPNVKICDCRQYIEEHKQRRYEHSFYLEQLIKFAIDDGVSHVAVLHVDSFPIRPGWAKELAEKLSETCVVAGIMRDKKVDQKPMTACMLFGRDFYLDYQPKLLLSEDELSSEDYKKYKQKYPHTPDSGIGYGFKVFSNGLSWYPLYRSNKGGAEAIFGSIYGDLMFHLQSAVQIENSPSIIFRGTSDPRSLPRRLVGRLARAVIPKKTRESLRNHIPENVLLSRNDLEKQAFERARQWLFEDPQSYLRYLRTGKKQTGNVLFESVSDNK
jgi:hypothetical protein